jgi:peptide/nickel transport system substrate-binding protein
MRYSRGRLTLAAALVVAAVGTAEASSSAGSPTAAAKPTLRIGITIAPATLDPAKNATGPPAFVNWLSADTFTRRLPNGRIVPELAQSFHYIGRNNKRFEFTLRKDARFSDGRRVDAPAAKAWLEYFKKNSPIFGEEIDLGSVETVGRWTVRMTLRTPNPALPLLLTGSGQNWGFISSPNGVADPEALGKATFGAGPYMLLREETVTGDHYTFVPNRFYYNKSAIKYGKVVVRVIPNPSSMLAAAQTGQVDVANGDPATADAAARAGVQVVHGPAGYQAIWLRDWGGSVSKPLADVRVRQALEYAIDRRAVTRAIVGKYGSPTSQAPTVDGIVPKLNNYYPYNPQKAKSLLTAAGYGDGFTLKVLVLNAPSERLVQAVASYWDRIGVRSDLTTPPTVGAYIQSIVGGEFPANQLPQPIATMFTLFNGLLKPGAIFNLYKHQDAELIRLWLKGMRAPQKKAAELWKAMSTRIVTRAYIVPIFNRDEIWYVSKRVGGFKFHTGGTVPSPKEWFPK